MLPTSQVLQVVTILLVKIIVIMIVIVLILILVVILVTGHNIPVALCSHQMLRGGGALAAVDVCTATHTPEI